MTVLLGCPAGLKLVFDPDASKNATGKEHFCTPVDGVPCFYFYRGKLSVLKYLTGYRETLQWHHLGLTIDG